MDVQDGTEPEDNKSGAKELKTNFTSGAVNLQQFFGNLEVIEEYFERNIDYLPYEGIEEKFEILQVS